MHELKVLCESALGTDRHPAADGAVKPGADTQQLTSQRLPARVVVGADRRQVVERERQPSRQHRDDVMHVQTIGAPAAEQAANGAASAVAP
jgi:hypothetical protein